MEATTSEKNSKVKDFETGMYRAFDHLNDVCREVSKLENEAAVLADDLDDGEIANFGTHLYIAGMTLRSAWEIFDNFLPC